MLPRMPGVDDLILQAPLHLLDHTWLVWTVRHRLTQEAHKMTFTLLRNAVGAPPPGGAGGLAAVVGAS